MTTLRKLSKIIFQCSVKTRELVFAGSFCLRFALKLGFWYAKTTCIWLFGYPIQDFASSQPTISKLYHLYFGIMRKVLIRYGNPLGGKKHGNYMVCSDLKHFLSTKLQQQLCNQTKTSVKLKKLSELLVICKSQRQKSFPFLKEGKKVNNDYNNNNNSQIILTNSSP